MKRHELSSYYVNISAPNKPNIKIKAVSIIHKYIPNRNMYWHSIVVIELVLCSDTKNKLSLS